MSIDRTVAFIGAGNMATALIRGLVRTNTLPAARIIASDLDAARLDALRDELGIRTTTDNAVALAEGDVVVLAVKPQVFPKVLPILRGSVSDDALVVSVAAGISTRIVEGALSENARVVRTMPNTPALVGAGATGIAAGAHATEEDLSLAQTLFESVGVVARVPEAELDAVTGLSGSGPAYVFALIEALRDAGVGEGLSEEVSLELASQTVFGAAKLLLEENESPETLRERVTSPGGTTRAGLDALEKSGFSEVIAGAVRAATRRSNELRQIAEGATGTN